MASSSRDAWNGQFIAKWPDAPESTIDLKGEWVWEGDVLVEGYILERWDKTTGPIIQGKHMVVGHIKRVCVES